MLSLRLCTARYDQVSTTRGTCKAHILHEEGSDKRTKLFVAFKEWRWCCVVGAQGRISISLGRVYVPLRSSKNMYPSGDLSVCG